MGEAVSPPCCLTWDQTMVEVTKKMVTTFKRSYGCTATLIATDPVTGHCQPTTPAETPGLSQASLSQSLVGSLLLSSGSWWVQGFDCALQESVFPVLYKFWQHIVGLLWPPPRGLIPHSGLLHPEPLPAPGAGHCWPVPLEDTLKHSKAGLAQSLWGFLVHTGFCLSSPSIFGGYGVWLHRWGINEIMREFILGASKSLQMVTAAMILKDTSSLEEKLWPTYTA